MTDEANVTIDFKRWGIILGTIATLITILGTAITYGSSYHEQFAMQDVVEHEVNELNKEIIVLAIQAKEDELSLIEYKQATGQASDLDQANKENILRRLADLKVKLEKLE